MPPESPHLPALFRGQAWQHKQLQNQLASWAELRRDSREFLVPWEPTWTRDALTRQAFRRRIRAYETEWRDGTSFRWTRQQHEQPHNQAAA